MSGSVSTWIKQSSLGDANAAARLYTRFWKPATNRAKKLIRAVGLVEFDCEDISERALSDLLVGIMAGQAKQIVNRRIFWRMLEKLTVNRAIDFRREEQALKRRSKVPLIKLRGVPTETTHEMAQILNNEELDWVSANLGDEARRIVDLLQQGFCLYEIAEEVQASPRTVKRRLESIRHAFQKSAGNL